LYPRRRSKARQHDLADGAAGLEEGNSPRQVAASMRPWFSWSSGRRPESEGNDAIIDHADSGIAGTRLTVGPDIATMTDREIVDVFNGILAAQGRNHRALRRPSIFSIFRPSSSTPAANHLQISLTIRRSPIRCSMNRISHAWLIVSKEAATDYPSS
jgi:hypothetical protein